VIYLGYGAQSTTLQVTPTGGAPYSYAWSPATGLSNATSAAPVFTPTAEGNYTFTVTVTNTYGCKTTCSITICVLDIRVPGTDGKKVYVCHVPQGNPANAHTIEVSINAVSTHIFSPGHGDHLGRCDQTCGGPAAITKTSVKPVAEIENNNAVLQVSAFPNPTSGIFNVRVQSSSKEPVVIRVVDVYGRIVLQQGKVVPNTTLRLGEKLATGTYVVEAIQGDQRIKTKVLKVR
jgi:PKD repeat protein